MGQATDNKQQTRKQTMTNDEYFNDKPMKEAIAKYRADCEKGYNGDVQDWLNAPFFDFTKGKIVRGRFFSNEEIEEKIRKMESVMVTGYLLEWKDEKTGEWFGSEFDPEKGTDTNFWLAKAMEAACDDWFENEVEVGFFKALSDVWFSSSCDWDFRLGAQFNAETTPKKEPKDNGIWEGLTSREGGVGSEGEPWRVRKITIGGTLSDKAKEFIRRNPDVVFEYAE